MKSITAPLQGARGGDPYFSSVSSRRKSEDSEAFPDFYLGLQPSVRVFTRAAILRTPIDFGLVANLWQFVSEKVDTQNIDRSRTTQLGAGYSRSLMGRFFNFNERCGVEGHAEVCGIALDLPHLDSCQEPVLKPGHRSPPQVERDQA